MVLSYPPSNNSFYSIIFSFVHHYSMVVRFMTIGRMFIQFFPRVLKVEPHRIILSQTSFSIQRSVKFQNTTACTINSLSLIKRNKCNLRLLIKKKNIEYDLDTIFFIMYVDYLLILKLLIRRNILIFV